jgi:hypothetical protein
VPIARAEARDKEWHEDSETTCGGQPDTSGHAEEYVLRCRDDGSSTSPVG